MVCRKNEARIKGELAALYESYGYKKFKLGCFEEYSLYQENKDFLIGKNVITFSDLDGTLLAMRPDVTLSIIKHNDVEDGEIEKFFYSERVFRQSPARKNYGEISQVGVEVIGDIDVACLAEVAMMICDTLAVVNDEYILDVSHMGITEGLLSEFGGERDKVSEYLKRKNLHDFEALSQKRNFDFNLSKCFKVLCTFSGKDIEELESLESVCINETMRSSLSELVTIVKLLKKYGYDSKINVNFSASGNADYYNGVIFNGYIAGIPRCVLSGGRYDKLLKKMGKRGGAVGFALYLGEIERYLKKRENFVDYLIIYDEKSYETALDFAVRARGDGKLCRLSLSADCGVKYGELVEFCGGGKV